MILSREHARQDLAAVPPVIREREDRSISPLVSGHLARLDLLWALGVGK